MKCMDVVMNLLQIITLVLMIISIFGGDLNEDNNIDINM